MALEGAPLPNMQSTARVLSILATDRNLHHWINDEEWGQWLRAGAASSDCRLSSCCTKALLMLESAQGDAGACIKVPVHVHVPDPAPVSLCLGIKIEDCF